MAQILVVDDTRNIRKMVQLTLEHAGHSVQNAEDGAQGLEMFGDGTRWDLTLVDQQMPKVEGREMIAEARKRDPLARLIMMTAFATGELATQVLQNGAMDFLRKPFSTDILRGAVEVALSHPRQALSPVSAPEIAELPQPGQPGFSIPRLSFRLNGFSFWPLPFSSEPQKMNGFEFGRRFQVHQPEGNFSRCFVGITPHIWAQVRHEFGREVAENDPFWEKLCGEALLNFIWEKGETPPDVLPVYEIPADLRHGGRSSMPRRAR